MRVYRVFKGERPCGSVGVGRDGVGEGGGIEEVGGEEGEAGGNGRVAIK